MNITNEEFDKNIYHKASEFITDSIIKLSPPNDHYGNEHIKILMPDWFKNHLNNILSCVIENNGNKNINTFYGCEILSNYEDKLVIFKKNFNPSESKYFSIDIASFNKN